MKKKSYYSIISSDAFWNVLGCKSFDENARCAQYTIIGSNTSICKTTELIAANVI